MLRVTGLTSCVTVVSMIITPFVETAEYLEALNDITLGTGLLNDIADSMSFAMTEVPNLAELGSSLTGLARPDTDHPQQLTQEQRDHAQLAEAFFLSPIGFSLDEMRGLPRLAAALVDGDRASRSVNSETTRTPLNSDNVTTTRTKTFSLRGLSGFDQAEMERLAETIAEGVANTAAYGFRTKNPLVSALAAVGGQRDMKPEEALPEAVTHLLDPLGVFSQQQTSQEASSLTNMKGGEEEAVEQKVEEEVQKQEESQQRPEEKELEQQVEEQVERQANNATTYEEKPEGDQVDIEPSRSPIEAALEEKVIEDEFGSSKGDDEQETLAEALTEVATEESGLPEIIESSSTETSTDDDEEIEQDEEEDGKSPQRFFFWSRTNPFGAFQPVTDMWYLTNWAFLNPLAMIEWKAFAFNQCMSILNNKELCLKSLKVEPNAVNHGGTNSAWKPSTAP